MKKVTKLKIQSNNLEGTFIAFKFTGRKAFVELGVNDIEILWDNEYGVTDTEILDGTIERYPFLEKIEGFAYDEIEVLEDTTVEDIATEEVEIEVEVEKEVELTYNEMLSIAKEKKLFEGKNPTKAKLVELLK